MPFIALLDASVLVPFPLADTLLRTAAAHLYAPRWSADILAEVRDTLVDRLGIASSRVDRRVRHMRSAFPEAEVTGYAGLIPAMPVPDEDDRHVVAAAVVAQAQVIVTSNVRHFPAVSLVAFGLDVQDPDTFLTHLYHLDPPLVRATLLQQATVLQHPPMSLERVLRNLEPLATTFVRLIREDPVSQ